VKLIRTLLAMWLAAMALLSPAAPAQAADSTDTSRRILVMLKMPPNHYRPGAAYSGSYGAASTQAARNRIAAGIAKRHNFTLIDNWPMPLLGVDCFVMALPDGLTAEAAVEQVSHDGDVAWSQPLQLYHAQAAKPASDPLLAAEPAAAQWHLAELHRAATGRGVSVAVIDSRIDVAHPDLGGQIAVNQDFVGGHGTAAEQHGTAIAGVIAAREGYGGIVGIAPRARLMGLRACWQQSPAATVCDTLSLAKALQFAIDHHARVINISLSGPRDMLLGRLVDIGLARGQKVVAAFDPGAPDGGFPASQPGVIAVSNMPSPGLPQRVLLAPGRGIPTTAPGGGWTLVDGTSYAAAHVSGLLALMNERQPAGAGALVRARGGSLDACASLTAANHMCSCDCAEARRAAGDERR
jgi:subtilisin family serine protease